MKIFGPGNTMLTDRQCRLRNSAVVSMIAEVPGSYRIEISSLDEQAVAGSFEIRVSEPRTATSKDKDSLAAEKAFAEGEQLQINGTLETAHRAIKKYEAASRFWRLAGDTDQQTQALKAIAEVWHFTGNLAKAVEYLNYCEKLSGKTTDVRLRADTLSALGLVHSAMGDNTRAMELCAQALEASKTADHPRGVAAATHCLGEVHYSLRDAQTAAAYYQESLDLWRALNDGRGEAQALLDLGHIHSEQGDVKGAKDSFQRALELWRKIKNLRGEAQTLVALGNLASKIGSKQEALEFYQAANGILDETGDLIEKGRLFNGKAYVFDQWEEKGAALHYYGLAAQSFRAAGYLRGEVGSLITVAGVHSSMDNYDKALMCLKRAREGTRRLKDINLESYALKITGDVCSASGKDSRALDYYNQALVLFRKGGDRRGEAYALNGIGDVHLRSGDKAARTDYSQALELNRSVKDQFGESSTLYDLARLEAGEGNLSTARASIESAIRIIELLRGDVGSPDIRASYFAAAQRSYELYIALLMRQHTAMPGERLDAAALHASERARARGLLESILEGRADVGHGVQPALLDRERTLRERLTKKVEERAQLLAASGRGEGLERLGEDINDLTLEYREVQTQIRAASPGYVTLEYASPATLGEIQELLDPDTLLLEYALGTDRSYLWAVTPSSLKSFDLGSGERIETAARRVYELLTARNREVRGETALKREIRLAEADDQYPEAASALSEMLLGPVASLLEKKRLVIVADGILQYIPFAALLRPSGTKGVGNIQGRAGREIPGPADWSPLFLEHEIILLPSASMLKVLRSVLPTRDTATKTLAVFADPVFSTSDARLKAAGSSSVAQARKPNQTKELIRAIRVGRRSGSIARLPHSGREADDICATAPGGCGLKALDFRATKGLANSRELSKYRVIHFATHSLLNSEHPDLSGILLSLVNEQGQPQDGFLQLHEIYGMRLSADLVVLSACQTALGKDVRGEGLIGLTRGFLSAGAAQVVSSLWKVDDGATADLMRELYKNLLAGEGRPAAALRAAQMSLASSKRWGRSPYYWAGFCLQGDWKQTITFPKETAH